MSGSSLGVSDATVYQSRLLWFEGKVAKGLRIFRFSEGGKKKLSQS